MSYFELTGGSSGFGFSTNGPVQGTDFVPTGLLGANQATRWVGSTTSGAPTSGTFAKGDFVIDQSGAIWICTAAGTPGTWQIGGHTGVTISSFPTGTIGPITTSNPPTTLVSISGLESSKTYQVGAMATFFQASGNSAGDMTVGLSPGSISATPTIVQGGYIVNGFNLGLTITWPITGATSVWFGALSAVSGVETVYNSSYPYVGMYAVALN